MNTREKQFNQLRLMLNDLTDNQLKLLQGDITTTLNKNRNPLLSMEEREMLSQLFN